MFTADFVLAYCTPLVGCGVFVDLPTCQAGVGFIWQQTMLTAVGEVGRGTVLYDPAAAAACIAGVPRDCTVTSANVGGESPAPLDLFHQIVACGGAFTGTAVRYCEVYGLDCPPGNYCQVGPSYNPNRNGCGLGTCQLQNLTPHQLGEDCIDNHLCQPPAVCIPATTPICALPPAEGAACDVSSAFPCLRLDDYCRVDGSGTTGTCVPRLGAGAACTVSLDDAGILTTPDPCQLDARCTNDGTASGATTCVPLPGLGAVCPMTLTGGDQCIRQGLFCTNNACGPRFGVPCSSGICSAIQGGGTAPVDCGD
jgi:hypothetical protein